MWAALLARFWKPLAGAALLIGSGWYLHHTGYESGYAASEAHWQPLFATAERERDAANERTRTKEAKSIQASAESQRRIDETLQTLHVRAADYDSRLRSLSVRLAASARRCEVPQVAASPAQPDGAAESEQRASGAGGRIAATGANCELDAASKVEWQRFYTEIRATINQEP